MANNKLDDIHHNMLKLLEIESLKVEKILHRDRDIKPLKSEKDTIFR